MSIFSKIKKLNKANRLLLKNHFRRVKQVLKYRYLTLPIGMDLGEGAHINSPALIFGKENIHLGNNCNIDWESKLYCTEGQFIMMDNSGAAAGLTVITNNHERKPGVKYGPGDNSNLVGKTILVEDKVWIAANVTLLAGAHVGRGAIIGAGSVLRACKVPPYAVVQGNPAKVVGFRYLPEEIIEHEKVFYEEKDRLPLETLQKNYEKYFLKRIKDIKNFVKI